MGGGRGYLGDERRQRLGGAAGEDDGARDIDDGAERRLGVEQEVAERDRQRAGAGGDADEDAAVAIGVAQRQQERLQPMEDVD